MHKRGIKTILDEIKVLHIHKNKLKQLNFTHIKVFTIALGCEAGDAMHVSRKLREIKIDSCEKLLSEKETKSLIKLLKTNKAKTLCETYDKQTFSNALIAHYYEIHDKLRNKKYTKEKYGELIELFPHQGILSIIKQMDLINTLEKVYEKELRN